MVTFTLERFASTTMNINDVYEVVLNELTFVHTLLR